MKSFDVTLDDINWNVRRIDVSRQNVEKNSPKTKGSTPEINDTPTGREELIASGKPNILHVCKPQFTYSRRSKDLIICLCLLILAFFVTPFFILDNRTVLPTSLRRKHIRILFAILFGTQAPYLAIRWHRGPANIHMWVLHNTAIFSIILAYERNVDLLGVITLVIAFIYAHIVYICYQDTQQHQRAAKLSSCLVAVIIHFLLSVAAFTHGFSPNRRPESWYTVTGILLIADVFVYSLVVYTSIPCSSSAA